MSVTGAHGRIWAAPPAPSPNTATGLVTVLQLPSSNVSAAVRRSEFTATAVDARGEAVAGATDKGDVYVFNLPGNRYTRVDRVGKAGTAALFSHVAVRQLFVAFEDCTVRCYDVTKGVCVGILREHRRCVMAPPSPCWHPPAAAKCACLTAS